MTKSSSEGREIATSQWEKHREAGAAFHHLICLWKLNIESWVNTSRSKSSAFEHLQSPNFRVARSRSRENCSEGRRQEKTNNAEYSKGSFVVEINWCMGVIFAVWEPYARKIHWQRLSKSISIEKHSVCGLTVGQKGNSYYNGNQITSVDWQGSVYTAIDRCDWVENASHLVGGPTLILWRLRLDLVQSDIPLSCYVCRSLPGTETEIV